MIKPGMFSIKVAADNRRVEFDIKNEVIVTNKVPVDFVFIGDSITHMWELNAYYGKKGRLILNRGIGGDSTEYVLKRFEADVLQLKPGYCIMMIGVNDSWSLEPEPGMWMEWNLGRSDEPIEILEKRVMGNLASIVDLAVRNSQKLAICSLLPTNMPLLAQKTNERNKYIIKMNEYIKEICYKNGYIYVDYHSQFVDSDGITLKDGLTLEGLHPHVIGYNVMADVLQATLAENGIEI